MQRQKSYVISLFIIGCIGINVIGKAIANTWELPVWLDSIGTVFVAYACGPVCGAIVGVASSVIAHFSSPIHMVYGLTSIGIGVVVGICARKKMIETAYGLLSTSFLVALISVLISTPLNYIFFNGYTGNKWGDGVIDFLQIHSVHTGLCYIIGEYYIDFIDKVFTLVVLYVLVQWMHYYFHRDEARKKNKNMQTLLMIGVCSITLLLPIKVEAKTNDYNTWLQTIYDNTNGFPTGIANDIAQTEDGIIWIGTYGGLYRYNGNEFQWMKDYDSIRKVNCLYTDNEGRLWVGSNTDGVSILINNEIVNIINEEMGLPSDSVVAIQSDIHSNYYIGTIADLAVVNFSSGLSVVEKIPQVQYAKSITSNQVGQIVAVTSDGTLFLVEGLDVRSSKSFEDSEEVYVSCAFGKEDVLYVGTNKNHVIKYTIEDNTFHEVEVITCENMNYINGIEFTHNGDMMVCSNTGVGYLDEEDVFFPLNTNQFNASFMHMLEDYQGNLWFASSKLGLLELSSTPFTELYKKLSIEGKVVNAITKWQDNYYIGTDRGLDIIDKDLSNVVENQLTEKLADARIRCLMVDSKNALWVCTNDMGAWHITDKGQITIYDSNNAVESKYRCSLELQDGSVVLAGYTSLIFIKDGAVVHTINYSEGIDMLVMNMLELPDGTLLLGTDGNGIVELKDRQIVKVYQKKEGLKTKIIMRMVKDPQGNGVFIVGGDSLYFMDNHKNIRRLNNFPYYNNYDIILGKDGELFVPSSVGVHVVKREELIADNEMEYTLLDYKKGLRDTLTANSWLYLDEEKQLLFLAGNTGATVLDLASYHADIRSYRMNVKSVEIDDVMQYIRIGDTITIPSDTRRFVITPEVVNYSVTNPNVSYYLEGFESVPQVSILSELTNMIYTNLPSGEYTFHLDVLDDKGKISSKNTYQIIKEANIYEKLWFLVYMGLGFMLTIIYLSWMLFRTQIQKTLDLQRRELALAQKKIQMSNEAILTIAKTVDAKDINTSQHSARVAKYSRLLAERLGFSTSDCDEVERAALLHDIGKIGIPDSVLNKPGRLTDEEYNLMKTHVTKGAEILEEFTSIDHIVEGARYHHERYDGRGYISGLKGEEIPLYGRLICIADAFDAMTSNRVYRKKLDMDYVINEIKKGRGTQFDPLMAEVFLELIEDKTIDISKIYEENKIK